MTRPGFANRLGAAMWTVVPPIERGGVHAGPDDLGDHAVARPDRGPPAQGNFRKINSSRLVILALCHSMSLRRAAVG